ncbi:MAG: glycosyltransferase family 10 domain-containing protein [Alphaproteobacteria bacterium]
MKKQSNKKSHKIFNQKINVRVNILTEHFAAAEVVKRQSPHQTKQGVLWKNILFVFNQAILPDDILVVWHIMPYQKTIWRSIAKKFGLPIWLKTIHHPYRQKIHIQTEPLELPFVRSVYHKKFLSQFSILLAQRQKPKWLKHGVWQLTHGGLEWWYGVMASTHQKGKRIIKKHWQDLLLSPNKTKTLSVITSRQNRNQQQKLRIALIDKLEKDPALQPMTDIFGHNRHYISDKAMGLEQYKYHIALENAVIADYWSEKLADALLAESYVFYAGAPNIYDYFDKRSIKIIDLTDPEKALSLIKKTIKAKAYEKNLSAIKENKRRVMFEENFFNLIWRIICKYDMT